MQMDWNLLRELLPALGGLVLVCFTICYFFEMAPRRGTLEWIALADRPRMARIGLPELRGGRWLAFPAGAVFGAVPLLLQWELEPVRFACAVGCGVLCSLLGLVTDGSLTAAALTAAAGVLLLDCSPVCCTFLAALLLFALGMSDRSFGRRWLWYPAAAFFTAAAAYLGKWQPQLPAFPEQPMLLLPGVCAVICLIQVIRLHCTQYLTALLLLLAAAAAVPFAGWRYLELAAFLTFAVPAADAVRRGAGAQTVITALVLYAYDILILEVMV